MISSSPNPDIGDCHCERSEAISARCDGIATHLSGARNDSSEKRFCFLNRDLGETLNLTTFFQDTIIAGKMIHQAPLRRVRLWIYLFTGL